MRQTKPHDSPGTVDFSEIPPLAEPPNAGGEVKMGDFRQIDRYISKTIQDSRIDFIKVE